jgi:voltage-gated potassium channel
MASSPPTPPPTALGRRLVGTKGFTATRALLFIVGLTILVVVASAMVMWLSDDQAFPTFGMSLWWAAQTVTTVGYGDVVPPSTLGRPVAGLAMLMGVAFISILSGVTASVLVESVRKRRGLDRSDQLMERLDEINRRLDEMESRR